MTQARTHFASGFNAPTQQQWAVRVFGGKHLRPLS